MPALNGRVGSDAEYHGVLSDLEIPPDLKIRIPRASERRDTIQLVCVGERASRVGILNLVRIRTVCVYDTSGVVQLYKL